MTWHAWLVLAVCAALVALSVRDATWCAIPMALLAVPLYLLATWRRRR